jgi:hypothetical protein
MKTKILALLVGTALCACGGGGKTPVEDMAAKMDFSMTTLPDLTSNNDDLLTEPSLTVDNTLDWCTVTVMVGNATPVMFSGPSMAFSAPAGTTITLSATPNPNFYPVVWTGVTTMNGANATYLMTSATTQSLTACCPTSSTGAGC